MIDRSSPRLKNPPKWVTAVVWLIVLSIVGFYFFRLARIGIDVREDFWTYWTQNHFYGDPDSALHNGRFVLRQAKELESADQANLTSDQIAAEPTIDNPGPGLLDEPRSLPILWQRYKRLRPVYAHIFRGWVQAYDNLVRDQTDGNYVMDYPPLRSLAMTLWAWKLESQYPTLYEVPRRAEWVVNPNTQQRELVSPDVIRPLLICNTIADVISSVAMFWLVWIWVRRAGLLETRAQWGEPLLLLAPLALGLYIVLSPFFSLTDLGFQRGTKELDLRITSINWWIYLVLRYVAIVALARFLPRSFRAVACATIAATMVWLNPASILDSIGWPQWEVWLIPFFLIAAVLVSLDCWLLAGLVLAAGGMFKGQLYFVAPVLILAPLFAGWFGRFARMLIGIATGAGLVVWPWLITNSKAEAFIAGCVFAAAIVCVISFFRLPVYLDSRRHLTRLWRKFSDRKKGLAESTPVPQTPGVSRIRWPIWTALGIAMVMAAILPLLIWKPQDPSLHWITLLLTAAVLTVPWFIRRRAIAAWLTAVFAASLWIAGCSLNGSFSWWTVGFVYGTQKHQDMQLGLASLSNLSSLLEQRYGWSLHDAVATLHMPMLSPIDLDVQSFSVLLYAVTLILCSIFAGIHLRRRDPKFLAALVAPWMLFVSLLTQMAARYTIFPAVFSSVFVGLSLSLSMFQFLLIVLSFLMLVNQLMSFDVSTAPVLFSITRPTYPDMGWLTITLAAILLVVAMTPSRKPALQ